MKPKKRWWETYPKEFWTAEDWAAYHRATGVPPSYQPTGKTLPGPGKLTAGFTLFPAKDPGPKPDPVDGLLDKLGIPPK